MMRKNEKERYAMESLLRSVYGRAEAEYVIKKSRFIATVCEVKTEAEAAAFIESVRKHYWDARHNCSAFQIGAGGQIQRSSDDGEPSGTAGRPILEVLKKRDLTNTAVVVTRYFGGIKLGASGLIRAYSHAAALALDEAPSSTTRPSRSLRRPSPIPWSAPLNALPKVTASSSPTGPLPPT